MRAHPGRLCRKSVNTYAITTVGRIQPLKVEQEIRLEVARRWQFLVCSKALSFNKAY